MRSDDSLPVITGFRLWLRSPDDVRVLRISVLVDAVSPERRLWTAGSLLVAALGWSVALHRVLQRRTEKLEEVMRSHRDVELEFASTRKERLRLAADLHDGIKQQLAAASFRVEAAAGHLPDSPDKAAHPARNRPEHADPHADGVGGVPVGIERRGGRSAGFRAIARTRYPAARSIGRRVS